MKPISEADQEDYRQQEGEERHRAFLERRAMMGGPEAPEDCEMCDGTRFAPLIDHDAKTWRTVPVECPRCLGTGVQP